MSKGIIMDIHDKTVIVLTNDGQFLTTHKKDYVHYQLGDEILIDSVETKAKSKRLFSPPSKVWMASAAAIVLLLASFLFNFGVSEQKVYAYVTVDINPSFELKLDDELNIIEIAPLNEEAEKVLAHYKNWEDQPLKIVTSSLIKESQSEGFLTSEQTVILSTVLVEEKEEKEFEEEIEEVQEEIEKENIQVKWFEGTEEDREKAINAGISTGKLIETRIENKAKESNNKDHQKDKGNKETVNQEHIEDVKRGNSSMNRKGSQPNQSNEQTSPTNSKHNEKEKGQDKKNKSEDTDNKEEEDLEIDSNAAANKNEKDSGNQNDNNGENGNKGNEGNKINSSNNNESGENNKKNNKANHGK
ncbi:MAG TPA: anti-sigma factor domain-containing protein [Bacillus sp. (in: firmicutes)]|uniref:anti-sigma factor domain-containing protein n=1 Tax=Bacillus litorisediminis TaxID=2922713 RepID=UPI001FAEDD08|nr:anti-sigma factor domain-containing protein [Bacillus litorisediminis]HWO74920.1 anti-sigma factor domain-containing protein [Bacillus sp. (in: firmicutes)]